MRVIVEGKGEDDLLDPSEDLDPGIADVVKVLVENGIQTFESCQGGYGHAYPEPTVCFEGDNGEEFKVLYLAWYHLWDVWELRRVWRKNPFRKAELDRPHWQLVLFDPELARKRLTEAFEAIDKDAPLARSLGR